MLPEIILVVANSARMAAQLAHQAGVKALVIDCFADCDTQAVATAFIKIPSLALAALQPAVEYFIARYAVTDVLYGSGFECYPESLNYLHSRLKLLGNPPDTFKKLSDKQAFFGLLDYLGVPYPISQFSPPAATEGWLVKPMQGQGGAGITCYRAGHQHQAGNYYQRLQKGTAHSVLFLADGQNFCVVAFNKQWTVALGADQAFAFAGVSTLADVPPDQQMQVRGWLAKLVPALSLQGLNSLDFICDGEHIYLLEINPRLSASLQLYAGNWLAHHVNALNGVLPHAIFKHMGYAAYQIIYADEDVQIPENFCWLQPCCDMPPAGVLIRKGQPICSIIAHQANAGLLMQAIDSLQYNLLKGLYHHGIYR